MRRTVLLLLLLLFLFSGSLIQAGDRIVVFVSILPQEYFVSRIGGELVEVSAMVRPGHSPATYEPQVSQLEAISQANLYFRIGVPFEEAWMEKIREANPFLPIVDTREGIPLLPMGSWQEDRMDPHIWLDPLLVKTQAQTIYRYLSRVDGDNRDIYQENLAAFLTDLDDLHVALTEILTDLPSRNLMVFHPAWGYFAHRYQLKQVPIEVDGKEPGPKTLAQILDWGREEDIGVIFVQEQFSQEAARTVAQELGAEIISINPLSSDYLENLRQIAHTIAGRRED